jgi:succinate dehydrogenase/fumarate reductase flavoprotein subunit
MADTIDCDVLIAGSGAGGLATALTARRHGLSAIVAEKAPVFGGSTAFSAGVVWIPANAHAARHDLKDTPAAALRYLEAEVGNRLNRDAAVAFVENAATALDFFERETEVKYALMPSWADYHPSLPGALDGGRSLLPLPFDGRRLGADFDRLRPPLESMMIFGGMMVARDDLPHLFNVTRSAKSFFHVAGLVARYLVDRLRHARGTRVANGNALIARMMRSALDLGVELWAKTPLEELRLAGGRAVGARVMRDGRSVEVRAAKGVVLACGGFPADPALQRKLYGHVRDGKFHRSLAPEDNRGDGIRLGEAAGGVFHQDVHHPAAWTPISLVPQPDGSLRPFPHFIDRGKPGFIAVDRRGRRFVNEALSYHDFVPAMIEACRGQDRIEVHLICDRTGLRRFGLGACPPAPLSPKPFLKSGYLVAADGIGDLARKLGIDAAGLEATIGAYNPPARRGEDPAFGKGGDAYQRFNGAVGHAPNPCVAPIETPPYYAVRLLCGDIGTFAGLRTDGAARVLDAADRPIEGLFAVGNDMASLMGGTYPGAGITIGPALTFGYLVGRRLAGLA